MPQAPRTAFAIQSTSRASRASRAMENAHLYMVNQWFFPIGRKFSSQTSDLWTDAATVVRRVREESEKSQRRVREESEKRVGKYSDVEKHCGTVSWGNMSRSRWHPTYRLIDLSQRWVLTVSLTYYRVYKVYSDMYTDTLNDYCVPKVYSLTEMQAWQTRRKSVHCTGGLSFHE